MRKFVGKLASQSVCTSGEALPCQELDAQLQLSGLQCDTALPGTTARPVLWMEKARRNSGSGLMSVHIQVQAIPRANYLFTVELQATSVKARKAVKPDSLKGNGPESPDAYLMHVLQAIQLMRPACRSAVLLK